MKYSLEFIKLETLGANLLLSCAILALICSNSPWQAYYAHLFNQNTLFIINDGLMTIFFLLVGLEIKYELCQGTLNTYKKACLPAIAAIGGMLIPALLYIGFNYSQSLHLRGWAIPTATDIAFALGALSLLGRKIPNSLKSFLTALAIFDDLAAIMIIAIYYTQHITLIFVGYAALCTFLLWLLNIRNSNKTWLYCLIGSLLWFCLLRAGIHATCAGVILAFMLPLNSVFYSLKHSLNPIVALGILPLFALANAGLSLNQLIPNDIHLSIVLGILISLFMGKQLGIAAACWLAVTFRLAHLPEHVNWKQLYGVAILCGIGFTISLFVGALAFDDMAFHYMDSVKLGVLAGSLLSGIVGYIWLKMT